jgi:hypothetical protein
VRGDLTGRQEYKGYEIKLQLYGKIIKIICENVNISDGYHLEELYDHRVTLFIALCRILMRSLNVHINQRGALSAMQTALFDGWFIMGINRTGKISPPSLPRPLKKPASLKRSIATEWTVIHHKMC